MKNYWLGKKVLVTGGAGLIGSHIVEELVKKGSIVTVADNLKRGNIKNLRQVINDIEFSKIDLTDKNACNKVCDKKDIVFHLASDAYGLSYSYTHHSEILTHNILLNTNILNACHIKEVKRVLSVSSSCVYSDDAEIPTKESEGFKGEPEKANIGYGWSKRILEIQANQLHLDYGMEIVIVRPANVYGPRDPITGEGTHVIPSLIHKVLFGKGPITVWGSGNQFRNFIYVKDVVKAMLLVTEKCPISKAVNIGSTKSTSMKELIHLITQLSGIQRDIVFDTSKPEGAKHKSVDINLLKEVIGFKPRTAFEEGLFETIKFYKDESDI